MVVSSTRLYITTLLFLLVSVLSACSVDLMGLFAANDQDLRLEDRNTFHFLTDADRNLALESEYSFIILTDTHIHNGDAHGLERLSSVITPQDAFAVILGDITQYGSSTDVQKFISIADTLGIPCYPVLGNHDIYFNNWHIWRDYIGSSSYRINGSNTTMFILDTANASVGNTQLEWLEQELKTAESYVFIFTHTNLFVKGIEDLQQLTDIQERARIMSILEGRCKAMFMGHVHKRIIKTYGGVDYITVEDFKSRKTYCRVQVSPNGLSYTFHTL